MRVTRVREPRSAVLRARYDVLRRALCHAAHAAHSTRNVDARLALRAAARV